ncbi:hypothetical protein [Desulfosporosinus sp. FKB]|uniref:hypothetical protein n=1 Tax=Desulfosporosinus sp. FKB TaxID=1969835 RepID=UPI001483275D|nr:hypothetical protein [Desulfosporosinus sp. FKB]
MVRKVRKEKVGNTFWLQSTAKEIKSEQYNITGALTVYKSLKKEEVLRKHFLRF